MYKVKSTVTLYYMHMLGDATVAVTDFDLFQQPLHLCWAWTATAANTGCESMVIFPRFFVGK